MYNNNTATKPISRYQYFVEKIFMQQFDSRIEITTSRIATNDKFSV